MKFLQKNILNRIFISGTTMINFIVYYGGRLFPKFLSFYFTAAHRFSKTHYYIIKIQSYNNTNGQFVNCPYNLVGRGLCNLADPFVCYADISPNRGITFTPPQNNENSVGCGVLDAPGRSQ